MSSAAGGWQRCGGGVLANPQDPDYVAILGMVQAAADQLKSIGRFDMPGFQPRSAWVREMQRYGILPASLPAGTAINPYEVERRYWQSLWWQPTT